MNLTSSRWVTGHVAGNRVCGDRQHGVEGLPPLIQTEREPLEHSSALGSDETVSTFWTFFLFFHLRDVPVPELELLLPLHSLSLSHLFMLHFTLKTWMEILQFPHWEKQLQAGQSEMKSSVSLSDLSFDNFKKSFCKMCQKYQSP